MERINKLTGKPVSEESIRLLERLNRKESVTLDEINELPEIKEAFSCINNSTPTIFLKDRDNIDNNVIDKISNLGSYSGIDENGKERYNGLVGKDYLMDIVIGLPASGKSSVIVNPLSQELKSRVIDSDIAKEMLPEFNSGWGAGVVHDESKHIISKCLISSIQKGENIIYPIVGSSLDKITMILELAKLNKYRIQIHFVQIEPDIALSRMINRFFETGRFLNPQLIFEYEDKPYKNFIKLKEELVNETSISRRNQTKAKVDDGNLRTSGDSRNSLSTIHDKSPRSHESLSNGINETMEQISRGLSSEEKIKTKRMIDGYSHWYNNVPRGQKPVLIETTCSGELFSSTIRNYYVKQLEVNNFTPTKSLINNLKALQKETHVLKSLKDISILYHTSPDNTVTGTLIKKIGDECRAQEKQLFQVP